MGIRDWAQSNIPNYQILILIIKKIIEIYNKFQLLILIKIKLFILNVFNHGYIF